MRRRIALLALAAALWLGAACGREVGGSGVRSRQDVFYTAETDSLRGLDVYWNAAADGADVVVFVHGGGWLSGDKSEYAGMATSLAARGMTVILVNYRLSPKVKFPAHVQDVAAAIAWAHEFAADYNGDPAKIYLMGHSAGGQMVTLLTCDPHFLAPHGLGPDDVAGVITISGVFEIKTQPGGATAKYLGMVFGDEDAWAAASCRTHIARGMPGLPPFLVIWSAGEDELIRNESSNLVAVFEAVGLPIRTLILEGTEHAAFVEALGDSESRLSQGVAAFMASDRARN